MDPKHMAEISRTIGAQLDAGTETHGIQFLQLLFSLSAQRLADAVGEPVQQYLQGHIELTTSMLGEQPTDSTIH